MSTWWGPSSASVVRDTLRRTRTRVLVGGGGGGEGGAVKGGTMQYNKIQSNTTRYKVMQYDTK